jgi:hypothetical protein
MRQAPEVTTDPDIKLGANLRRYLDLPKFLHLLHSRSLYLRRADGFTDRFEGALTPVFRRALDDAHKKGEIDQNADYFYRRARAGNYVSCWTQGTTDNMALWQLYGGIKTSVAVNTTVERLIKVALTWKEQVLIHRVQYIDHTKNPDMVIGRYTDVLRYKNEAYQYENELRVLLPRQGSDWSANPMGIVLPVAKLSDLIASVVVAPEADEWFLDVIKDLCKKYQVSAPVRRSRLAYLPT